jgi:hypothetical protein
MNTAVATRDNDIVESVLIKGDLGKLNPGERAEYYTAVCRSVGLNPLTQPFAYIVLNGKLTLYALRGCTDQLRAIHNVSVEELTETERDGVFVVTCKVRNGEGRTDMAKGAVTISNLKGDALANCLMKAETKAKRRATLSLCGLGLLDETEVETIPGARPNPHVTRPEDIHDNIPAPEDSIPQGDGSVAQLSKAKAKHIFAELENELHAIQTEGELRAWASAIAERSHLLPDDWQKTLRGLYQEHRTFLRRQNGKRGSMKDQLEHVVQDRTGYALHETRAKDSLEDALSEEPTT